VLYLLDANVLITAHNQYYPTDVVPEFWDWVLHMADAGVLKVPAEVFEEVAAGHEDGLHHWINGVGIEDRLVLQEDVDATLLRRVLDEGYAPDLTDTEVEQVGQDPFLIAYGLADTVNRTVVSVEVSKPSKQRANRKVPDVCGTMKVLCCDPFTMMRRLGFKTGWKAQGAAIPAPSQPQPPIQ